MAVGSTVYGAGRGNILLDNLVCTGNEASLAQCRHSGFYNHDCVHREDVGVQCNPGDIPRARLVNGTSTTNGRLEVWYRGNWSTVCDDLFGAAEAEVACRMLGFASPNAMAVGSATYGEGRGSILLDDLVCSGNETSLAQCRHSGFYNHNCGHSEDVGIQCNPEGDILRARLVNGTSNTNGRLEVWYQGNWSTVCDDFFGAAEAEVACRMLGFSSPNAMAVGSVVYGAGRGSILLDNLVCTGNETSLAQCRHNGFYNHDCVHREDVGVQCNPGDILRARLVNGTSTTNGRLEVWYRGNWSTVCDDLFGAAEAQVACRMLGFSSLNAMAVGSSIYGAGRGNILLDNLVCTGNETSLAQCRHNGFYNHDCGHREDVGVQCNPGDSLRASLVNGTSTANGRLEVWYQGNWSTVCDDGFGALEARVACRMLGFVSPNATAVGSTVYGAGRGNILLDGLVCTGNETSLAQCRHNGFYIHDCRHSEDVGVQCNSRHGC